MAGRMPIEFCCGSPERVCPARLQTEGFLEFRLVKPHDYGVANLRHRCRHEAERLKFFDRSRLLAYVSHFKLYAVLPKELLR